MGYDENVTRHSPGIYTFTIPSNRPRYFQTVRTLSEYRSNNVTGRMPRVWLVKEVNSEAKEELGELDEEELLVLKDVWLQETAPTEKEIQNAIFRDIEAFWDVDDAMVPDEDVGLEDIKAQHKELVKSGEYKKYFLGIDEDWVGQTTKPCFNPKARKRGLFTEGELDATQPASNKASRSLSHLPVQTRLDSGPNHDPPSTARVHDRERAFAQRNQYRVIFKDVCRTVGDLKYLGEVMDVLGQTLIRKSFVFVSAPVF